MPLVVLNEGEILQTPTVSDVAAKLGLSSEAQKPFYDLAIVGAGPAGLAAAVYGASEGLKTLLIEQESSEGRPGPRAGLRTIWAFRLDYPARIWPAVRSPRLSALGWKFSHHKP